MRDTWGLKTSKGKKHFAALLRVLKRLQWREDLWREAKKEKDLRDISYHALVIKLSREEKGGSQIELGKAWARIPRKGNLLTQLFPDEKTHQKVTADLKQLNKQEAEKLYPQLTALSMHQWHYLRELLDVTIPKEQVTSKNWWLVGFKTNERKDLFQKKYLDEFRDVVGITNQHLLGLWPECPNEDGLREAAYVLGELRNRIQIRAETKTAPQVEKAIEERMKALIIQENALNAIGIDALHAQLTQEFVDDLGKSKSTFGKEQFLRMMRQIVWTEGSNSPLTVLIEMVRNRMSIKDKFLPYFSYISLEMAEQEAQKHRGISNRIKPGPEGLSTVHGIGRFAGENGFKGGEDFEFPRATAAEPFEIAVKDFHNWDIIVATLNIGLPHPDTIAQNPAYLIFAEAQRRHADSLIIVNPLDIDILKVTGGISKVGRAIFSGVEENLDVMDPDYRSVAERIFREHPDDETVCTTSEEMLADLMRGYSKIAKKPKKKPGTSDVDPEYLEETEPVYTGKICVIGGIRTDQIAKAMVYGQVRYHKILLQNALQIELKVAQANLKRMEKLAGNVQTEIVLKETLKKEPSDDPKEERELRKKIEVLHAKLEKIFRDAGPLEKQKKILADRVARERLTFVHPVEWKRFVTKALSYIAGLFEKIIPNAKMLGLSSVSLSAGNARIEINVPHNIHVTDTHLADYCNTYGPKVRRGEMADVVALCPPYAFNYRTTGREVDAAGTRGSAEVCVVPMCVDDQFIRESARNTVEIAHPIGKAVFSEQIGTGALLISCRNGVVSTSFLPLESLGAHERRLKKVKRASQVPDEKYLWWLEETDIHVGSRNQARMECNGWLMTVGEVVFESLRACGYGPQNPPPFHFYVSNDDEVQGQHFPAHRGPHQHQRLPGEYRKLLHHIRDEGLKMPEGSGKDEALKRMALAAEKQEQVRGLDWTTDQMREFIKERVKGNADVFEGVLNRFTRAEIELNPVSMFERESFEEEGYDRRDLGVITFGAGNHATKTFDQHLVENFIYCETLIARLEGTPMWIGKEKLLERYIRSPIYGNEFVSYGIIKASGGYAWGVDLRSTPASRGMRWGDPLLMAGRTELRRGNIARIFEKKMAIHLVGNNHFYVVLITGQDIFMMGPPQTQTDSFAEMAGGLPPNNSGVAFLGLPAEGPKAGPILLRPLLFDDIKKYIAPDPKNFDWENFLSNAL